MLWQGERHLRRCELSREVKDVVGNAVNLFRPCTARAQSRALPSSGCFIAKAGNLFRMLTHVSVST